MINLELLDKTEKRAYQLIDTYGACAQSALRAIQEMYGYENCEMLLKASVVLAGGVGAMYSTCGALTGAALGLGLKYGRDISLLTDTTTYEEAVQMEYMALETTEKLARWFEREFGSIICYELRKAHMGTFLYHRFSPWQAEWYEELGTKEFCKGIVAKTARRAAALLDNPNLGITEKV